MTLAEELMELQLNENNNNNMRGEDDGGLAFDG